MCLCVLQVSSHFSRLYVEPSSPEQCSHNTVVFVDALRSIGIDYDCLVRKTAVIVLTLMERVSQVTSYPAHNFFFVAKTL